VYHTHDSGVKTKKLNLKLYSQYQLQRPPQGSSIKIIKQRITTPEGGYNLLLVHIVNQKIFTNFLEKKNSIKIVKEQSSRRNTFSISVLKVLFWKS